MPAAARWAGVAALCFAATAAAQDAPPPQDAPAAAEGPVARALQSPVLVLRRDALFDSSAFGKAARERFEAASQELLKENRTLEAALEAEERDLTAKRATLPADEFRVLAEAFDTKVEGIRSARDARSRDLTRGLEEDRQRFLKAAIPILAQIMAEHGATVILDQQVVVVSLDAIDITADAVRRIDAAIGKGEGESAPAPDGDGAPPP